MPLTPRRPRARTARLFVQGIAAVYAIAFASLAVQVKGLYGSRGILPVAELLAGLAARHGDAAPRVLPTVFWWSASDAALVSACWAGAAAAVAMMAGRLPTLAAALCWLLYFSLFQVGRVFLAFQWDTLLLEAGFLAIFVAPATARRRRDGDSEPSPVVVALLRWLLLRLMFSSGAVKLLGGDPAWWNLTALEYHYWTQPLPTWTAWFAHLLPPAVHRAAVAAMFAIELVAPWFVFGPRPLRLAAFGALVLLQAAIASTGNYGFFNLLTVVLALPLLDDDALEALRGALLAPRTIVGRWPVVDAPWTRRRVFGQALALAAALPLATAGGVAMVERLSGHAAVPAPLVALADTAQAWRLVSSYGLFASMTVHRPEIEIEGTEDGVTWHAYPMRWKPGDVLRRPRFVAPFQPRLDWQMWFAALGDARRSPWLVALQRRLLEGSTDVLRLFADDPFDGRPPRAVRAVRYEYRFTDWKGRVETGAWWTRRAVGPFSPAMGR